MKLIRTIGGGEFTLQDEDVVKIRKAEEGGATAIWLEGNDRINLNSIDSIADVPKIKMYKGQRVVDKFGVPSFYDSYCGEVIAIDFPKEIIEIDDPSYKNKNLLLKNGKNNQRDGI